MEKDPTTFVSYSWDSKEHKNWALFHASKLFQNNRLNPFLMDNLQNSIPIIRTNGV